MLVQPGALKSNADVSKLFQKYQQMQDATQNADQMDKEELVEILRNYLRIFKDLDAEFEKFFNEFENVSKL